jgi:HSP20 family molecular chaperone IbpA
MLRDPFRELSDIRDSFDCLFKGKVLKEERVEGLLDNNVVVEAELPGVNKKDVDVSVKDSMLTIKGEIGKRRSKGRKISIKILL